MGDKIIPGHKSCFEDCPPPPNPGRNVALGTKKEIWPRSVYLLYIFLDRILQKLQVGNMRIVIQKFIRIY